ncbi:GntR family transcriptional regulator [Gallaecimonas sp. GXIMD4217]|uniref:GntR family transcriptional regulator n=1 Tax=Gallaecimonas sp. GXIMD4217 TaxID=3131927 RepID=UPI00311B304C
MQTQWQANKPIYEQLVEQLVAAILEERIAPGQALPSVRQLAGDMQVNPLTVQRALAQLAEMGVVEKRRGVGSFVSPGAREQLLNQERQRFLEQEWPEIQRRIKRLDLSLEQLLANQ